MLTTRQTAEQTAQSVAANMLRTACNSALASIAGNIGEATYKITEKVTVHCIAEFEYESGVKGRWIATYEGKRKALSRKMAIMLIAERVEAQLTKLVNKA